jgi:CRP-like cAMP-binding protein
MFGLGGMMISPELLRRFRFFGNLGDAQLKTIAMLADEESRAEGYEIFHEEAKADRLYLLLEGSIDLYLSSAEEFRPEIRKEFAVGEINPGEIFGVSALVAPHRYSSTARTSKACRLVVIEAEALRARFEEDPVLAYKITHQVAQTLLDRLTTTRIQLAAAWA